MSDFTIRTSTTPPATVKVQLDPSQSVAEAVAAADAAAASQAAADGFATAAAGSATDADASAGAANASAISAAGSAAAASTDADDAADSAAAAAATLASSLKTDQNLADLDDAPTALTNLGVTATAAELNILDGVTATAAELNVLDGVAASTADINKIDGLDAAAPGAAPIYACRAWVNFNGTGTVAIRASGNVSSITDNGTGSYTVNFTTAMIDANYAVLATCSANASVDVVAAPVGTPLAGSVAVVFAENGVGNKDQTYASVAVFR